jgi:hypothetical protein
VTVRSGSQPSGQQAARSGLRILAGFPIPRRFDVCRRPGFTAGMSTAVDHIDRVRRESFTRSSPISILLDNNSHYTKFSAISWVMGRSLSRICLTLAPNISSLFGGSLIAIGSAMPNRGRMDHLKVNIAARSRDGVTAFCKVSIGLGAFALMSSGLVTRLVSFDSVAVSVSASSFAERFGPQANSPSADPPSIVAPVVRFTRGNFDAEFDDIKGLLSGKPTATTKNDPGRTAVSGIPVPKPRPVEANVVPTNNAILASADNRTVLQKITDLMPSPNLVLASLTNGDGLASVGPDLQALGFDETTAVYDISSKSVYMPNRVRLEAHSGLGGLMDDPAHVNKPNVGATPPNVYELKPRERPFHGVQALRMIPVGDNDTLGRSGLLVHSYLLGANGDSNGCVSIKNYDRFLNAFKNGSIKRLIVVPSLSDGLQASGRSNS